MKAILSKERRWEISTSNSDWTDEDIWEAIARAQAQHLMKELVRRMMLHDGRRSISEARWQSIWDEVFKDA